MMPMWQARGRSRAGERGAVMMFILLFIGLIVVVTAGVLLVISADLAAGVRQLQAVRVFNIAEAGVHYAIARMQGTGADSYSGETIPITDGISGTVLGTATVAVSCVDPAGATPPCSGAFAAYRRVVSVGTLPVPGPRRTIVAVIEGYPEGLSGYAICAEDEVYINQGIHVYGDVGSNGDIVLMGPSTNYARIRNDPPPPFENPENRYYSGSARAVGVVNCSQGCATQVAGTTTQGAPGPVCPTVPLPTFSAGAADRTVSAPETSFTMNSTTGYSWQDITVRAAGTASGCTGTTPFRDLVIQTGGAGTTTVVNVRRLTLERCARLIIAGDGNVDLRVAAATGTAVLAGQYSRLGMLPTDTAAAPAPAPASRLRVSVLSNGMDPAAVQIDRASIVTGTWHVPNGEIDLDQMAGQIGEFYGAILSRRADIDRNYVFTYDPTANIGVTTYSNFTRLRSWKDQ